MYEMVVGTGEIGTLVIDLTVDAGLEVVVVEKDEQRANIAAREYDWLVINDDATTQQTLEDAGAAAAEAIIATTDSDAVDVMVMLLAEELEVDSKVSVVPDAKQLKVFRRIDRRSRKPAATHRGVPPSGGTAPVGQRFHRTLR